MRYIGSRQGVVFFEQQGHVGVRDWATLGFWIDRDGSAWSQYS